MKLETCWRSTCDDRRPSDRPLIAHSAIGVDIVDSWVLVIVGLMGPYTEDRHCQY